MLALQAQTDSANGDKAKHGGGGGSDDGPPTGGAPAPASSGVGDDIGGAAVLGANTGARDSAARRARTWQLLAVVVC